MLPPDPFGRTCTTFVAAEAEREHRIALCAAFANAVIEGHEPPREAQIFVASAVAAWLAAEGARRGDLERRYLRTHAPSGSRHTAQALARKVARGKGR